MIPDQQGEEETLRWHILIRDPLHRPVVIVERVALITGGFETSLKEGTIIVISRDHVKAGGERKLQPNSPTSHGGSEQGTP